MKNGMFEGLDDEAPPVRSPKGAHRPMLAAKAPELTGADFPMWLSPKVDGHRCLIQQGRAMTRSLEFMPNGYVQAQLGHDMLNGLDGEICVGPPNAPDVCNRTNSGVSAFEGEPDFIYWVFDIWSMAPDATFEERYAILKKTFEETEPYRSHPRIKLLPQVKIYNVQELLHWQAHYLALGYEGVCVRRPDGTYKPGRSTDNPVGALHKTSGKPLQPWVMLKVKKFSDGEATVLECIEMMHNDNELEEDNLGQAKRSSAKDGLRPAGCLGSFRVKECKTGVEFSIGSGFDQQERELYWNNRVEMLGLIVKYKYFEVGVKDAPRFPVFLGFRNPSDM